MYFLFSNDNFIKKNFILRLFFKFSAPNLLALHPPLIQGLNENCATCYGEHPSSKDSISGVDSGPAVGRGLVTEDDFKVCFLVIRIRSGDG